MTEIEPQPEAVPSDVWEQAGPQGGAGPTGQLPTLATAVVVQGVTAVREAPPLRGYGGRMPIGNGETVPLVGRAPQRRRILIAAEGAAVRITAGREHADQGPLIQAAQQPVAFHSADELFATAQGANCFASFWVEIDQG